MENKSKQFYDYTIYPNGIILNSKGKYINSRFHNNRFEVRLKINGERKHFILARLLYWLFIKKFDISNKDFCVSYKDGNSKNLVLDNLKLINRKNLVQGENHVNAKLKDNDINTIKSLYTINCLSGQELADKYNVSRHYIYGIVHERVRNKSNYLLK